ncbi:response regulator transcription factor, partial [Gordonibacter sp.]
RPGDFNEAPSSFDAGCDLVCGRYDLTTREREVFALLAHGLNRASICDELTLSKETVKTHVRNIYRKLGVHSQQDVVFLVAAEQQTLGGDETDADEEGYDFCGSRL